jgi:hypothetical protein
MQRVSLLKEVDVGYSTGTVNLFTANAGAGKTTLPVVNGWIPCSQELPPVETEVLILVKGKRRVGTLEWDIAGVEDHYKSYQYWEDSENHYDFEWDDVTHWQHLPPVIELQ